MSSTATGPAGGRVVILALDTFGDLALREPLLTGLATRGFAVTVVVRRGYEEIVPYLDHRLDVIVAEVNPYTPPTAEAWTSLAAVASAIRRRRPDVVVASAHNRTYVDEWLLHQFPECPSVGFANPLLPPSILDAWPIDMSAGPRRATLFTRIVECPVDAHETEKYRALYGAITDEDLTDSPPRIALDEPVLRNAATLLRELGLHPKRYVLGCPTGTQTIALKAWPAAQYAELAAHLNERHQLPVLLVGSGSERAALDEIRRAGEKRGVTLPMWTGGPGTIGTLLGLIAHSRLYFGNDTGPMHMAGALDIPVVARFGGGHWPRFVPMARRAFSATQRLPCFKCGWECWLDDAACMKLIDTATFVDGLDWALRSDDEERRLHLGRPLDQRWSDVLISAQNVRRRHDRRPLESAPGILRTQRPKVFVVTPSFNQGTFLRETIESVLSQDYQHLEYFVADGGSADESIEILRSYGDRVRWTSGPDGGQAAAIARAWKDSDADIVAWLNSDDTYLPGAIAAAADHLVAHPDAAMVYGRAWYTNAAGQHVEPYRTKPFDPQALAGECFICQPAAFVRRDALEVIGLPDPGLQYCMDYDLWIRFSRRFRADYIEQFLATSRMHPTNKTLGQTDAMLREIIRVARKHFGAVHRAWTWEHARYRWQRSLGRFRRLPTPIHERAMAMMDRRVRGDLEGFLFEDGWAGRRTVVPVDADDHGLAFLTCECSAYAHPLRIRVSCDGELLTTREIRTPGAFVMAFALPERVRPRAEVLFEADRSFIPILRGLSSDPRALSFRICGSAVEPRATRPAVGQSRQIVLTSSTAPLPVLRRMG